MSINEKALLVKLSLSQWYNKVIDRKVADEIAQRRAQRGYQPIGDYRANQHL